jgi:hypothetical protein
VSIGSHQGCAVGAAKQVVGDAGALMAQSTIQGRLDWD